MTSIDEDHRSDDARGAAQVEVKVLGLKSLTPAHRAEHALYSNELIALLTDDRRRELVWNIALSGGYGSGKSSVLAAVREKLPRRTVEVSLSSLSDIGVDENRSADDINAYIQKEIVKQLLYREPPSRVPGSRFKRVSRLPRRRAIIGSILIGVLFAGFLWLTGWGVPFDLEPNREGLRPILLLLCGLGAAILSYAIIWLLHNRIRVDKLGTASTSVSLTDDADASYFDEYLDEIVYFFEMTRRDVLIIEDLDRFEDPTIYASLRALNIVLNSSRQLRRRPVHFIYAVRDSIFQDLLEDEPKSERDDDDAAPTASVSPKAVWQADALAADAATQRTKFFDLVLPIVPFITHRTSADLLAKEMEFLDADVPMEILAIVGRHVTDMRLLNNIMNEYRVFRARIIEPKNIAGLTVGEQFAMVAFKNTHLQDFENIRVGESSLDRLYRDFQSMVAHALSAVAAEIAVASAADEPLASVASRADDLGQQLQALASRWLERLGRNPLELRFKLDGAEISTGEVTQPEFWGKVIDGKSVIEVWTSTEDVFHLDVNTLRDDLGRQLPQKWMAWDQTERTASLQALYAERMSLRSADFSSLLESERELMLEDAAVNYESHLQKLLVDPLLVDLVKSGFLTRNYALYSSEFYGVVASANAMTFIVQHLQTERPAHAFPLSPQDVRTVISEGGRGVFTSVGLYNGSIYDELLASGEQGLERNIQLLSAGREVDQDFLRWYCANGKYAARLIRRLARSWRDVFHFLAEEEDQGRFGSLTTAALLGADPKLDYKMPTRVANFLATNLHEISQFTSETDDVTEMVAVLRTSGVRVNDLSQLSRTAADRVAAAGAYTITQDNLRIALRLDPEESTSLDRILRHDAKTFHFVVNHLREYLDTIDASSPGQPSLETNDDCVAILDSIETAHPGFAIEVLRRASPDAVVEDVTGVPVRVLTVLASAGFFTLTYHNVQLYLTTVGADESLIELLEANRAIAVDPSVDMASREALFAVLINDERLSVEARLDLADSITSGPVSHGYVSSREPELIAGLVANGHLLQDATVMNSLANSVVAQVEYVRSSSDPLEYLPSATMTAALASGLIDNLEISSDVREFLISQIPLDPTLRTAQVFEAIAGWLKHEPIHLPPDVVQIAMAGDASTRTRVEILAAAASELERTIVEAGVRLLPAPYSELLQRDTRPIDLPADPNPDPILQRLWTDESAVSSWDLADDHVRVWRRYPKS